MLHIEFIKDVIQYIDGKIDEPLDGDETSQIHDALNEFYANI